LITEADWLLGHLDSAPVGRSNKQHINKLWTDLIGDSLGWF
jgi:uncharacterized protein (DUF779 family)